MQCKVLFTGILLALSSPFAMGQQKKVTKNTSGSKSDSLTALRAKTGNGLLADNVPVKNPYQGVPYAHVPLAGEKAYYGEKNEYMNDFVRKYMEAHNRTLSSVQSNSSAPFSVIDNILEQKKNAQGA